MRIHNNGARALEFLVPVSVDMTKDELLEYLNNRNAAKDAKEHRTKEYLTFDCSSVESFQDALKQCNSHEGGALYLSALQTAVRGKFPGLASSCKTHDARF